MGIRGIRKTLPKKIPFSFISALIIVSEVVQFPLFNNHEDTVLSKDGWNLHRGLNTDVRTSSILEQTFFSLNI